MSKRGRESFYYAGCRCITMWLPQLTDDLKTVLFKDAASVSSRKDAEFTPGPLRSE